MCPSCASQDPALQAALNYNINGQPARNLVYVSYGFFPLPFHVAAWVSTKLVFYFMDQCQTSPVCKMDAYKSWCFANQNWLSQPQT